MVRRNGGGRKDINEGIEINELTEYFKDLLRGREKAQISISSLSSEIF